MKFFSIWQKGKNKKHTHKTPKPTNQTKPNKQANKKPTNKQTNKQNPKTPKVLLLLEKRCIIERYKWIICTIKEKHHAFFSEQTYWKNGIWWWNNISLTVMQVHIHRQILLYVMM